MPAVLLDPVQLQAEATALEQQEAWDALLALVHRHRPGYAADERLSGYLDYLAGRSLVELNNPQEAVPLLRGAARALPDVPFVHNLLGRALAELQDWLPAAAAQQRCLDLKPDFGYAWLELGRCREALGDVEAAVEAFQAAIPLLPDNDWLAQRLAVMQVTLQLQAGECEKATEAIFHCGRRWRIQPVQLEQWLQIAASLLACGDEEGAYAVAAAIREGTEHAGCPSPLGSRCALIVQALAFLLSPHSLAHKSLCPSDLAGLIQESLWLPNDAREDYFWTHTLQDQFLAAVRQLSQRAVHSQRELLPLVLALGEVVSARFKQYRCTLSLLHVVQAWSAICDEQKRLLAERSAIAAVAAARATGEAVTADQVADHLQLHCEAIRVISSIPSEQRSQRLLSAFIQAQLSLSGRHLPSDLREVRQLADLIFSASRHKPLSGPLRHGLDQLLWRLNSIVMQSTEKLAHQSGDIPAAQKLRSQGLQLIAELTSLSLNPPGLPPMPSCCKSLHRWLFLASTDLPQCFLYRVQQKREQLEALNHEVSVLTVESLVDWRVASQVLWADALVVCRLPGTYPVLRTIGLAQRFGIPVYYDMDDLIFDSENFPPPLASYGGTISADLHTGLALDAPLFRVAMEQTDAVIFSTLTLARRWRELHPTNKQSVFILPNLAPLALMKEFSLVSGRLAQPFVHDKHLRILVSSGTLAHKQVWVDELAPALATVLERNPALQLDLIGSITWPDSLASAARSRIRSVPFSDYSTYLHHLGRAHIGLAPLEPGIVTDAKSAIKWMEYSLMGLATVLSPTATYREILIEEKHCLFAQSREDWVNALERLIHDTTLRERLAREAFAHATQRFSPPVGHDFWRQLQSHQLGLTVGRETSIPCRKVLVINCFFAPQSVGGATKVAQQRVRELLTGAQGLPACDVTVLCVDLNPWQGSPSHQAIPLDVHFWHGAKVLRLGLPPKPWDWHHDGDVEQFCHQWFKRENFDEIEAHSMQILTAAPLRVAKELGIPYRVVLHDGWWISRLQFLTKDDGTLVDPADPTSDLEPETEAELRRALMERRKDLIEVLEAAEERLAVSESFADLYRSAGIRGVGVRRNQVSAPTSQAVDRVFLPSINSKEVSLRFCMVGGMAIHKGYAVLRAAIQVAQLGARAVFTIVDHRLDVDDPAYSLDWGGSRVVFIPPIQMDSMHDFYATQDVLIAPSIWPESFGLVTREALAAGLWVVASETGALAEPIEHGINGFRVNPGDVSQLATALRDCIEYCLKDAPFRP